MTFSPPILSLLLAAAVASRLAAGDAVVTNLIPDPSFEAASATSPWRLSDSAAQLTTAQKRSGQQSLMLANDGKGVAGQAVHNAVQTGIPIAGLEPGREYVFTVQVKAENVTGVGGGGKPLVVLRWRDATGRKLAMEMYNWAPYGTYDFRPSILHLQAPEGAAQLDVGFRSWWDCLTGVTWWDDVSFHPRLVPGRGALIETLEAETAAVRAGGKVADNLAGFSGTGYFVPKDADAALEWNNVAGDGECVLAIRYSWEGAAKPLELSVNGASLGKRTPALTGRRGSYATENWPVRLAPGPNVVRLAIPTVGRDDKVRPMIDRLEVYRASSSARGHAESPPAPISANP